MKIKEFKDLMQLKSINTEEAKGKIIKEMHMDFSEIFIIFNSGEYFHIELDQDYDSYNINQTEISSYYEAHRFGLITKEDFEILKNNSIKLQKKQKENSRYQKYLILKKEFE